MQRLRKKSMGLVLVRNELWLCWRRTVFLGVPPIAPLERRLARKHEVLPGDTLGVLWLHYDCASGISTFEEQTTCVHERYGDSTPESPIKDPRPITFQGQGSRTAIAL
jgi:hypothetical protein